MAIRYKKKLLSVATLVAASLFMLWLSLGALRIHSIHSLSGVWTSNIDDAECELTLKAKNPAIEGILKCRDREEYYRPVEVKGIIAGREFTLNGDGVHLYGKRTRKYKLLVSGSILGFRRQEDVTFARGPWGSPYRADNPFVTDRRGTTLGDRNRELALWIGLGALSLVGLIISSKYPVPPGSFAKIFSRFRQAFQPIDRRRRASLVDARGCDPRGDGCGPQEQPLSDEEEDAERRLLMEGEIGSRSEPALSSEVQFGKGSWETPSTKNSAESQMLLELRAVAARARDAKTLALRENTLWGHTDSQRWTYLAAGPWELDNNYYWIFGGRPPEGNYWPALDEQGAQQPINEELEHSLLARGTKLRMNGSPEHNEVPTKAKYGGLYGILEDLDELIERVVREEAAEGALADDSMRSYERQDASGEVCVKLAEAQVLLRQARAKIVEARNAYP